MSSYDKGLLKCFICGKEFDKNEIKGIECVSTSHKGRKTTKKIHFIKNFKIDDLILEPCQDCLLPFAKGILFGRRSVGAYSDIITFRAATDREDKQGVLK